MRPVEDTDEGNHDHERLLDEGEATHSWTPSKKRLKQRDNHRRAWTVSLCVFASTLFCMVGISVGYWVHDLDETCSRHTTHYSPVLSNVPIKYQRQRFNGSLLKQNIYRQDASPEVDAAWEAIGANYRPIRVPVDQAAMSGITPGQVQISEAYGGGYPANIEGFHHLHCLNLLRQSLYYNYNYYHAKGEGAFKNDDFIVRRHVSHCLDILRQQLMCTIDVGVLGQVWIHPEHPSPFVDFNTEHVCRNFEDIRAWAEMNQLPLHEHGHGHGHGNGDENGHGAEGATEGFLIPPQRGSVLSEVP
ncbi:oxidase ustYa family protein [Aspergillus mulundensis]|uniref:Tat pathway signal sequence n=1 Tax=Aspergillus mulundensis TaxID=1810919 RepID=A0A3D8RFJ0_9EURO|nr:Uncharacterized protein DSM5745_07880 [Aspergillus mulundensis]RDW72708.1 Uncharacterized protein DSM5745_07880 [Aspergillus mulundensis]